METKHLFQNRSTQNLIVRKKRIHKLQKYDVTWNQDSQAHNNDCMKSDREHDTRSQSFYYNKSLTSEENEFQNSDKVSPISSFLNLPMINQETFQQELLRILEKHTSAISYPESKYSIINYDKIGFSAIKAQLKLPQVVNIPDKEKTSLKGLRIKIKKPTDYEFCYLGPDIIEPSVKSFEDKKVNSLITESINFDILKDLLLHFFTHRLSEIDLCVLTPHEKSIFQAVLERKNYSPSQGINFMSLDSLKSTTNLNPRRSEEKFKFIIKRIIKYLKKKEKIKSEKDFYHIYFSDLSDRLEVPLNHFYDPHNKLLKNSHFKSLSTDYVMLLLKSELFLIELLYYLENDIVKDHIDSLHTKVGNLCKKWESIYETLQKSNKSAEFIKQLILNTEKGSKLPWSVGEVSEAIDLMKNIIYNWNSQKYIR